MFYLKNEDGCKSGIGILEILEENLLFPRRNCIIFRGLN